jgi:hypothetical protein
VPLIEPTVAPVAIVPEQRGDVEVITVDCDAQPIGLLTEPTPDEIMLILLLPAVVTFGVKATTADPPVVAVPVADPLPDVACVKAAPPTVIIMLVVFVLVNVGVPTSVAATAPRIEILYVPGTSGVNVNWPKAAAVTAVLLTAVTNASALPEAVIVVRPVAQPAAFVEASAIKSALTRTLFAGTETKVAVN